MRYGGGYGTTSIAIEEKLNKDKKNRHFIMVQLPELTDSESEAYKAGYKTIADISKERIRRVIKKIESENNLARKKKEGELKLSIENFET